MSDLLTGKLASAWPEPDRFPKFLDKMGKMMSEDYDWSADVAKLPMPVMLVFCRAELAGNSSRHLYLA